MLGAFGFRVSSFLRGRLIGFGRQEWNQIFKDKFKSSEIDAPFKQKLMRLDVGIIIRLTHGFGCENKSVPLSSVDFNIPIAQANTDRLAMSFIGNKSILNRRIKWLS